MAEAAAGAVRVEKVRGRSALTRCFARYPLKLIAPSKVGPASCDAVWLYALTYGGGIVSVSPGPRPFNSLLQLRHSLGTCGSAVVGVVWRFLVLRAPLQGDTISCTVSVGDGCTAAITTQASTKVWLPCISNCLGYYALLVLDTLIALLVVAMPVVCSVTVADPNCLMTLSLGFVHRPCLFCVVLWCISLYAVSYCIYYRPLISKWVSSECIITGVYEPSWCTLLLILDIEACPTWVITSTTDGSNY